MRTYSKLPIIIALIGIFLSQVRIDVNLSIIGEYIIFLLCIIGFTKIMRRKYYSNSSSDYQDFPIKNYFIPANKAQKYSLIVGLFLFVGPLVSTIYFVQYTALRTQIHHAQVVSFFKTLRTYP